MNVSVVLPWRDGGCPYRRSHYWALRARLAHQVPGVHVVTSDSEKGKPFNRSQARNRGVDIAAENGAGVVVVMDTDNLVDLYRLPAAAVMAWNTGGLVKPFTWFGYWDQRTTDLFYAGTLEHPTTLRPARGDYTYEGEPQRHFNGGSYVLRLDAWRQVGGFDEGFTGWGAEDDAFTLACQKALGAPAELLGVAYHLWHPAARVTSKENYEKLMKEYVNAE